MLRSSRALFLLAALLWQSMSMLGSWSVSQSVGELEHLVVHSQDVNHHHHADSTLHMDEDDGSVQHLHADFSASPSGLLTSRQPAFAAVRSMPPAEINQSVWLSPTLEGLLRPPTQRA